MTGFHTPGSQTLLDGQATAQELARLAEPGELRRFDVLHLACHVRGRGDHPECFAQDLPQDTVPHPLDAASVRPQ